LDEKDVHPKDAEIHEERTQGKLPPLSLFSFDSLKIPFYFVRNHNAEQTHDIIRTEKIDIIVNAGTPRILKTATLRSPRVGVLNCHPGLLPRYRGCTCVEWAIFNDEQVGNTAHFMSEGIDEGPIILSEGLTFRKTDRYADIRTAVYANACTLLARAAKKIMDENLHPSTLPPQTDGSYWNVIESEKMQQVLEKLDREEYAYQLS
jgi:methionyl-tRNA formyltransferase